MPEEMDGGRLVAQALADEGVKVVFTLCGGHIMPIYEGCLDHDIRVVDVRHEQAATMAADGWARMTGDAGVALVTAGPGVMNGVTGVANAQRSDSPVVTIGGGADVEHYGQGALQEGPQVPVLAPLTKWQGTVYDAHQLHDHTLHAIRNATAPRSGPTFLEIPWDILFKEAPAPAAERGSRRVRGASRADPDALDAAAQMLADAEKPVVVAGGSIHWSRAHTALQELASVYEAPYFMNGLARGALPTSHPRFLQLVRGMALADADVVLNLGAPFDFRLGFAEGLNPDARVIHADVDARDIGQVRAVDVGLVGNLAAVAEDLTARVRERSHPARKPWMSTLAEAEEEKRAKKEADMASSDTPIHAMRLVKAVKDAVDDDTIFVGDGGNIVALAAKSIDVSGPNRWMDPGPFGTLGVGLPFAMSAKLAEPDKRVLVLEGDGSFGLNGFEFESLVRHDLPVVIVVGNDGAWTQIRGPQVIFYGEERAVATALGKETRYDLFAESMGGHGELVQDPDEITPAIDRAFASGKPAVVNVLIDAATNQGAGKPM